MVSILVLNQPKEELGVKIMNIDEMSYKNTQLQSYLDNVNRQVSTLETLNKSFQSQLSTFKNYC